MNSGFADAENRGRQFLICACPDRLDVQLASVQHDLAGRAVQRQQAQRRGSVQGLRIEVVGVPVPGSLALLAGGLLGLVYRRRSDRRLHRFA